MGAVLLLVIPRDLTAIIDTLGLGDRGVGDIHRSEDAVGIKKTMGSALIDVDPHDLAALVDPIG